MKDRIYSMTEIYNINANLNSIERRLGHPAPKSLVNYDSLSKGILSLSEIELTSRNIESVERLKRASEGTDFVDEIKGFLVTVVLTAVVVGLWAIFYNFVL